MEQNQTFFQHILVPSDGSQPALEAGKLAVRLAKQNHAHLTFVYVVDNKLVEELSFTLLKSVKLAQEDLVNKGKQYLNYLAVLAENEHLEYDLITSVGTPYIEIEKLVRKEKADLIVIGQTSRLGLRRMLIGSVTQRVVENVPCPVLIVK